MAGTYSIQCRHCETVFDAPSRRHKVCSRACSLNAHAAKQKPRKQRKKYEAVALKECGYCGITKEREQFYRRSHDVSGLSYGCKPCAAADSKNRNERNRDAYLERRRANYADNREALASDAQLRYWKNYAQSRERAWRVSHGIDLTWDQYLAMKADQCGRCAICERHESSLTKSLAVDHDHESGKVRGLLCDDCNIALGRLKDDPKLLQRAVEYLTA